jgi:hypothetical protein
MLAQAVAQYRPIAQTQIGDLKSSIASVLYELPCVAQIEVRFGVAKPRHRIIQLRDWHVIPKDRFAAEIKHARERELPDAEIEQLYQEHLYAVEGVQLEQISILRCLIKHHGLTRICSEGLTPDEMASYMKKLALLRTMDNEQIPELRKQLDGVRKLKQKEKAQQIEEKLHTMLDEYKYSLLEIGAAGRLLITRELESVLPLEDATALQNAMPILPRGNPKPDSKKIEERHDAQVRAALKDGPVAMIVLGGSHDLSGSVRRLGGGQCEYLRITTKKYQELAGE